MRLGAMGGGPACIVYCVPGAALTLCLDSLIPFTTTISGRCYYYDAIYR